MNKVDQIQSFVKSIEIKDIRTCYDAVTGELHFFDTKRIIEFINFVNKFDPKYRISCKIVNIGKDKETIHVLRPFYLMITNNKENIEKYNLFIEKVPVAVRVRIDVIQKQNIIYPI